MLLGELLARQLNAQVGDKITLMLPEATLSPAGVLPRVKRLTVSGIFAVGAELDASMAVVNWPTPPSLSVWMRRRRVCALNLPIYLMRLRVFGALLIGLDGDYSGSDWTRTHGNLFQSGKMEKP